MPKCFGIGITECHQMANHGSAYCSGCHRKILEQLLEKASQWLLWIKLRNKCKCEPDYKCVKCIISKELKEIDRILPKDI